jgi:hypothetical protein
MNRDDHANSTHQKYDYDGLKEAMDTALTSRLNIEVNINTEHEWDAAISAFAAFKGSKG